ncbi:unnamed protein product [Oikopleura dioica]|uniref:Uncharacterized protein n=1 Tax=Oikopleura dioica TaxID=34765 RepID=E4XHT3_OIKDI|nr:unnamed protein product [Oikopleura dioica]
MFYYGEKDECLVQVLKEWKEISEKDRRFVSLIKPENMHIVSARLFLESAIPRENALCAEIYMRSIILCELEEKPTYVTLPEDADIYLYGFAIDFVYEYARNEDGKMTFSEPEWKIQNIRNWAQNSASKKINLQINILFDKIGNLIRKF